MGEDGGLIAGHARILAARQLGIAEIPVMVAAGWSEAQKRAYVLADNQLAITGSGWDTELLRLELGELNLAGFDFPSRLARGRARAAREGKCWRFYPPSDPLQAALRLAPLIVPMIDLIQSARFVLCLCDNDEVAMVRTRWT